MAGVEHIEQQVGVTGDWRQVLRDGYGLRATDAPVATDTVWGYRVYDLSRIATLDAPLAQPDTEDIRGCLGRHSANAIVLEIDPGAATEPLHVTGNVSFKVAALIGQGVLVSSNCGAAALQPLVPGIGLHPIHRGTHYAYTNASLDQPLAIIDASWPPFRPDHEALSGDRFVVSTLRALGHGARLGAELG